MYAIRYQIQRRVALSSCIAITLITVLNIVVGLVVHGMGLTELLVHPSILVLLALAALCLITSLKDLTFFRIIHVAFFLGYPLAIILVNEELPYDISFLTWSIYGLILCIQYRLLQKRMFYFIGAYIVVFLVVRVIESVGYQEFTFHAAIGAVILLSLFVYLFWVVFAKELREYVRANDMLQKERNKNLIFVKFGRNIAGVVHNMKSVMMSFSGYGELIYVHDPDSIRRIMDLQRKASDQMISMINNFMTAVRSYQKAEVSMIHLNELVVSSVEISRGNQLLGARSKIHLELGGPDVITAKPMEIMQIVDNLIKNAAESMIDTDRYDLYVRTGSNDGKVFLQVEDKGIGIDFCARCHKADCMRCKEFSIGKSNKPDGTGIGIVYIREILKEMGGNLSISSLPDSGTTVTLFFQSASPEDTNLIPSLEHPVGKDA